MKTKLIRVFLATSIFLMPLETQATLSQLCNLTLSKMPSITPDARPLFTLPSVSQKPKDPETWSEFEKKIIRTGGLRLLARWDQDAQKPITPEGTRGYGLWKPPEDNHLSFTQAPLAWSGQLIPRFISEKIFKEEQAYDVSPFDFQRNALNLALSQIKLKNGKRIELSTLSVLASNILVSGLIYILLNNRANNHVDAAMEKASVEDGSALDELLRYDYRFYDLWVRLTNEKRSQTEQRIAAEALNKAFRSYYETMATEEKEDFDWEFARFSNQILFYDISKYADFKKNAESISSQNKDFDSFIIHKEGQLSHETMKKLYENRNLLYGGENLIAKWLHGEGDVSPENTPLLASILKMNYSQAALKKIDPYQSTKIEKLQLQFLLQRNFAIYQKFQEWKKMGVEPLVVIDGNKTSLVLKYEEVRDQMLDDLKQNQI